MRDEVKTIVRRTSIVGGVLGVVLSPIPLADELLFVPIYAAMASRIGKVHGLGLRQMPWRPVMSTTLAALVARAAVNVTVSYIPGVAAVANAASAVAVTHWLGDYVDGCCDDPANAKAVGAKEIGERIKRAMQRKDVAATV